MTDRRPIRDELATKVVAGEQLDRLATLDTPADRPLALSVMRGWEAGRHEVAASDLLELLCGQGLPDGTTPHPSGLQLR